MLPEGPAVWAEAPPTSETTHLRERKLTTQLTSPSPAHTRTITHIHKRTLNFKHTSGRTSGPDTNAGWRLWSS